MCEPALAGASPARQSPMASRLEKDIGPRTAFERRSRHGAQRSISEAVRCTRAQPEHSVGTKQKATLLGGFRFAANSLI